MRHAILLALLTVACAPAEFQLHQPLTRAQFQAFTPGVTTPDDAKAKMGVAFKRAYDRQGNLTLTWVGGVVGRQYQEISLRFGPDGKMTEEGHTYAEAGDETRGDVVSGSGRKAQP